VALVVLVIGGLAATALSNLVRGATAQAGLSSSDILATIAKVGVWAFAIVIAVNQLGIAQVLINTLLIGVVGALALATGLAFGLGGRDRAEQLLARASQKAEEAGPQIARAASNAKQQASAATGGSERWQGWKGVELRKRQDPKYKGPERRFGAA
jgi:hypothetical protein